MQESLKGVNIPRADTECAQEIEGAERVKMHKAKRAQKSGRGAAEEEGEEEEEEGPARKKRRRVVDDDDDDEDGEEVTIMRPLPSVSVPIDTEGQLKGK